MPNVAASIVPHYVPEALAASKVGTWQCSLSSERVHCDAAAAYTFGISPDQAHRGITFTDMRERIHPADRHVFDRKNAAVAERGGFIVTEYRVVPQPGVMRWVLVRGRYQREEGPNGGDLIGHGVIIDITDTKLDGHAGDEPFFVASAFAEGNAASPLQHAADAAITLGRHAPALEAQVPGLRALVNMLLYLIGRRLARDVPREELE